MGKPLQRINAGFDKFMGRMAGPPSPFLSPQEQEQMLARQRMSMTAALLQGAGPVPRGTSSPLGAFGNAIQAGQQSGDQFTADALRARLMAAQTQAAQAPDRQFGVINPSDFTPDSMAKYAQTSNWADLVPRENKYGRYNPSQYTTESWAKFRETDDESVLVLRPEFRFQQTPSGAVVAGNTLSGEVTQTSVTPEAATAEAAARKEAEAQGAARGGAMGTAEGAILTRALKAEGITDILDIAEPLIDEATGSGSGAARDKLAAFFGVSTEGAQATAQLLPLQAAIMLNQPRMEGPQSDRDVELYRQAAGQIGDPSVPRETKKAALQTIRRLQDLYKGNPTGGARRIRVDAEGNVIAP
jgi:hypothetical protein